MKAFTIVELIIYIAIVSLVLFMVSNFAWDIIEGSNRVNYYREVQQNARFAMEKIVRIIRAGGDPSIFYVSEGTLYQDGIPLTTEQVKVVNFEFIDISNTYNINLEIEYNNLGSINGFGASINLNSTVCRLPSIY